MKLFRKLLGLLVGMIFISCGIIAETAPYLISGEMVMDPDFYDEDATFVFSLYNKSEKEITSFTIVFYLFDEDGNSPITGRANVVNKINILIAPDEKLESSFSLAKYITVLPEYPYTIDYLYLSNIAYSDGTSWSDPFGLLYF